MAQRTDYVIEDRTHAAWPGRLPYRTSSSKRGYLTREQAEERIQVVVSHYNSHYGCSPGDLRVVERTGD